MKVSVTRVQAAVIVLIIIFATAAGVGYNYYSSTSSTRPSTAPSVLHLAMVKGSSMASLNLLSPVYAYQLICALYMPFATNNMPPMAPVQFFLGDSVTSNSDYTQWIYNLKQGLKWDNGVPLNATDLSYTLYLYKQAGLLQNGENITAIKPINSTAVQVNLNASLPNFFYGSLANTSSLIILPYQVYKNIAASDLASFSNFKNIVADGPYVTHNYTVGQNPIILQANPYFYMGPPHFSQVAWHLYSSYESAIAAYKAGEIDALGLGGTYSSVSAMDNAQGYTLYPLTEVPFHTFGIIFNLFTYPFNITQFRQALAFATNVTQINYRLNYPKNFPNSNYDLLNDEQNSALGLSPSQIPSYRYNLAMTNKLLTSIGFKMVNGNWQYPDGTPVVINYQYASSYPDYGTLGTLLTQMWATAGFKVNVASQAEATIVSLRRSTSGWQVIGYDINGFGSSTGPLPTTTLPGYGTSPYPLTARLSSGKTIWWNSTYLTYVTKGSSYVLFSEDSNNYYRKAALTIAQSVPVIPILDEPTWIGLKNSYYWGDHANHTGAFNTEQEVNEANGWGEMLWMVKPNPS